MAVVTTLPEPAISPPDQDFPLVNAVKADLDAAGRLDTPLGQQAVRLAQRMCSPYDTGSALAAVSKELRSVMAEALKDVDAGGDALDELAERRLKRAAGG
jgi:hypothetical protein